MMPLADRIAAAARRSEAKATALLAASQRQTTILVVGIGIVVVALGLLLSYLIGRSITRPLDGLARRWGGSPKAIRRLRFPATESKDEIGRMARTVIVFRDNADRARAARLQRDRSQPCPRATQRADRDDHRAVRAVGRSGARQGARCCRAPGWGGVGAQRRRRCGVGGSQCAPRRGSPPRPRTSAPPQRPPRSSPARSRRSREQAPNRPRSPDARYPRRSAPSPRCRTCPTRQRGSARSSA